MRRPQHRLRHRLALAAVLLVAAALPSRAQDRLCDPGNEDCRSILINYIRNETVAIDVAFWFMEDARYTNELILKWRSGVPVRVLVDPRANAEYPLNAQRLAELQNAGIPMRKRLTNNILHWKMMLFQGQNVVEFSGANYSADAWRPFTDIPYENYVDEAIYFTGDRAIVNSFRTRFDDQWVDTAGWANYANVSGSLSRRYGIFPTDASLNFVPWQNYRARAVAAYKQERRRIDVIMYRITDRAHSDGMLAAVSRGVPVRLITEPEQYRDPSRMWDAWNIDRLYVGGVQIRQRAHQGLNHQKSVILQDQDAAAGDQPMVIFGSSNWTSPSASGQVEHNMFTTKPHMVSWFVNQFERKWNNSGGVLENVDFVPLPPDPPTTPAPAIGAVNVGTSVRLTWIGGPWSHFYDIYLDTNPNLTNPIAVNLAETSSKTATSTFGYTVPLALRPGTTYYWRVVGKTVASQSKSSPVWSFTTAGFPPCAGRTSDFDGDCRSDVTVFRPSDGRWYIRYSRTGSTVGLQWGTAGDIPVAGDYDGDGKADLVVYRPSNGVWFIRHTRTGSVTSAQWGTATDIPVPGDYDADGWTDLAVFRPSNVTWYIYNSRTRATSGFQFGLPTDVPVPGDYDGDRKTDLAVWRPSTGTWFIRYSSNGSTGELQWGTEGDLTIQADYDGDGRTDPAVFRPSIGVWFIIYSSGGGSSSVQWGIASDRLVPGDYDGDRRTDLAVFRPSQGIWYVQYSATGASEGLTWGISSDIPIVAR